MHTQRKVSILTLMIILMSCANYSIASTGKFETQLQRAYKHAIDNNFIFPKNEKELNELVKINYWTKLDFNNPHYRQIDVRYPYVRYEVKAFVEHISPRYSKSCEQIFTNTGGSRHLGFQPPGAHKNTVHNAGMAIDLRSSRHWISEKCRLWLDLALEKYKEMGLIDYFEEIGYPHFHVMVYGTMQDFINLDLEITLIHRVEIKETLASISKKYGVTVDVIAKLNEISDINRIKTGQKLLIP